MENKLLNSIQMVEKPVKPLTEQVVDQIRTLIIEQHMSIGSKLPTEMELAQQLNVGRGTVREAVKQLTARNVLEIKRGRGTFIADNTGLVDDPFGFSYLDDEDRLIRELFQIRMQLEPWTAELAAEHATQENLVEVRKRHQEMADLLQKGENSWVGEQNFHVAIATCTQNRVLPMLIPVITYSVHLFMKHNSIWLEKETLETHEEIVKALEAHDPEWARQAMRNHLALNLRTVPELKDLAI